MKTENAEFTENDIVKLKALVPHLDDLMALLEIEREHAKTYANEDFDAELTGGEDEDAEEIADEAEPVQPAELVEDDDCDEGDLIGDEDFEDAVCGKMHDAKSAFGANEPHKTLDSVETEIDRDAEIANAWAKRYGK